jgi:16S rRNA G966 N2-methylase RsmD
VVGERCKKMVDEEEEKVKKVLEAIEVGNLENLSRSMCVRALGRLMAIKIESGRRPSKHELTKEVRRAIEHVLKSPFKDPTDNAVMEAVFMDAPFESSVLNKVYRLLLGSLLKKTIKEVEGLTPMWKMRLVNLMMENVYNVATTEGWDYRERIFSSLKGGESK